MYLDGLDRLDQKILSLLVENARYSYSEIGEKVGLSRVAVKARVSAMEEKGIIEQYTAVINPQKISGSVSCYFEIEVEPSSLTDIIEALYHDETVTQIYRVTGNSKLHVHAVASCHEEMEKFVLDRLDHMEGISHISSSMILSRIKDIKGLRL